jgi:glycosyltransferase involved in cell wall biosynthesis
LAIEACNELGLPLKIVGTGSWEKELKHMAGPTIEFVGSVTDDELVTYYKNCKALLFPAVEDFGLTVVEAQSYGKPVIAFRGGGALETIRQGKTGLFFDEQTKQSFIEAIKLFEKMTFDPHVCQTQAEKFSTKRFKENFLRLVNKLV